MASRPYSAECRLVFHAAAVRPDLDAIRGLAAAVTEWDRVCVVAEREVATASLRRALLAAGAPVPAIASDYLARSAMVSDFRMRHVSARTQATVAMLRTARIPVMLLKGAAIGAMRDPTFCERPMTDVDLLVRPIDVARAREVVIASGWPETTDPVLLQLLRDHSHLPHFVDPQMPGVRLELHRALLPADNPFAFDDDTVWRDARPAPPPFEGASLPAPEHLVVHAAIHLAWQHQMLFGAWRTIRLVSGVLDTTSLTWDRIIAAAENARAGTVVHWTLRLASRLAAIPVPAEALDRLAPPNPAAMMDALERHFVAGIVAGEGVPSPSQQLARILWRTALRPRWSGHRSAGRLDPEDRWARARGTISTETRTARYARHLADYRSWWNFLTKTLLP